MSGSPGGFTPRFLLKLGQTGSKVVSARESVVQLKLPYWDAIWPRGKKLAVWLAAAFVFYTVLGYLLLPPIARVIAMKQLSKHLDRTVTIEKVGLNPYKFSATIRGLLIKDWDGEPLVSWDVAKVWMRWHARLRRAP